MNWTFLSTDRPLTKTYIFNEDGSYESMPYPRSLEFTSHIEHGSTLEDLFVQITVHAEQGHCLLKGNLERSIRYESRAGLTRAEPTSFVCLDLDGLNPRGNSVEDILEMLGVPAEASYILQYSASQGIKPGLNAHIFLLLDKPISAEHAKQWLKYKNLTVDLFKDQLALTKSQMALHWPLDITVCQNDKLLYIAPPHISGREDPLTERIQYVARGDARLHINGISSDVDITARDRVKQLRSSAGLPDHTLQVKYFKGDHAEILANPDISAVTGVKRNGPFTYLNLNGGDSWGYFFHTARPDLLHNFKGEPIYRLREIAPGFAAEAEAYAKELRREAHLPEDVEKADKSKHWIINRVDEGRYYKVSYKPGEGVELNPAPSMKHVEDFCILNRMPIPDAIEDWKVEFDPTTTQVVDPEARRINTYQPTLYRTRSIGLAAKAIGIDAAKANGIDKDGLASASEGAGEEYQTNRVPERYWDLIRHVCGGDNTAARRFINWVAYIWQKGIKPETAWIFHGTYGTGKGKLLKVLGHLFGKHCVVTSPEAVAEQFNADIEEAQILWIDEVTTDSWDSSRVTPKLRNWITDNPLKIRKMRRNAVALPNYMGIIIAGNEHNVVEIRDKDRRFNVAPRQEVPLLTLSWATDEVLDNKTGWLFAEENLLALGVALQSWQVDVSQARNTMENQAKRTIMQVTQSLPEDIVGALLAGNATYFLGHVPTPGGVPDIEGVQYKQVVEKMMEGGRIPITTAEIQIIFNFLAGWNQKSGKFNKAVARYGLSLSGRKVRDKNKTCSGIPIYFYVTEEDRDFWTQHNDPPVQLVDDTPATDSGRPKRRTM